MKKKYLLLLLSLPLLFISGCKDKDKDEEPDISPWFLSFYLADSLGNNLLPYDLPDTPVINPNDYYVNSGFESEIFSYNILRHKEMGYVFSFEEYLHIIRNSSLYQTDSVYKVTVCFAKQCDTVVSRVYSIDEQSVHFYDKTFFPCGTKWVVWGNNDTLYPKSCAAIPVMIK